MPEQIQGKLEVLDNESEVTITLRGTTGVVKVGDSGKRGMVDVKDASGTRVVRINGNDSSVNVGGQGNAGEVVVRDKQNRLRIKLNGDPGNIRVRDAAGRTLLQFDSRYGLLRLGNTGNAGDMKAWISYQGIQLWDVQNHATVNLSSHGSLKLGGSGRAGGLAVYGKQWPAIRLEGSDAELEVGDTHVAGTITVGGGDSLNTMPALQFNGETATLYVGATGHEGDVIVRDDSNRQVIHADGKNAALYVGATGNEGDVVVRDAKNKPRIWLDGGKGDIGVKNATGKTLFHFDTTHAMLYVGGRGNAGDVVVRDEWRRQRIKLNGGRGDVWIKDKAGKTVLNFDSSHAALSVGGHGNEGDVVVRDEKNKPRIHLDGGTGDIKLYGADCAEDFDVAEGKDVAPGTVLSVHEHGVLRPCAEAYDRRVAGVVSGANGLSPGIRLGSDPDRKRRLPVALTGTVYCKVDAEDEPIAVGDLLTTSSTPGHAMKASRFEAAFGAVLGKALRPLDEGKGMIPILVSLQ